MFQRPLALTALALSMVACTPLDGGLQPAQSLELEQSGEVLHGEFVISRNLTPRELDILGLQELRWNDTLGAGLYLAEEGVEISMLKRALEQEGASGVNDFVESNRPVRLASVNDPYYGYQWNLEMLDIESAWDISTGAGVTVAVIDTGVSFGLSDSPRNRARGYDFVDDDADPTDENGHGTHVAGTIAQATNNGRGVAGVAYDVDLMAIRTLDRYGSGSTYDTASGIVWAVDNGADVINLSLGSPYATSIERNAVEYAIANGVVVVAATGNDGRSAISYPAGYDGVLAVGAVRADGRVASYSNYGSGIDLVAPGGDTSVDQTGDGYGDGILQETLGGLRFFEGTSMASPHVAGIAALVLSAGASSDDVPDLLKATASNNGSWNRTSGFGLVDPVAALDALDTGTDSGGGAGQSEPAADTTAPTISGFGGSRSNRSLTLYWTTDEAATSQIEFEGYGVFGSEDLVTSHDLRFTIDRNATYTFRVLSTDAAGNTTQTGWYVTRP